MGYYDVQIKRADVTVVVTLMEGEWSCYRGGV